MAFKKFRKKLAKVGKTLVGATAIKKVSDLPGLSTVKGGLRKFSAAQGGITTLGLVPPSRLGIKDQTSQLVYQVSAQAGQAVIASRVPGAGMALQAAQWLLPPGGDDMGNGMPTQQADELRRAKLATSGAERHHAHMMLAASGAARPTKPVKPFSWWWDTVKPWVDPFSLANKTVIQPGIDAAKSAGKSIGGPLADIGKWALVGLGLVAVIVVVPRLLPRS